MDALTGPNTLWLAQALITALTVGLAVALWVGLLLVLRPPLLFAVNARLSRWIDTRAYFQRLDQPYVLERWFYRHHRIVGLVITLGASLVLWRWDTAYRREDLLAALGHYWVANQLDWIIAGLEWSLVVLNAGVLVVGLIVLIRPSLLKSVERFANRWHRVSQPIQALDRVIAHVDRGFEAEPRLLGFAVAFGAAWSLAVLLPILGNLLRR